VGIPVVDAVLLAVAAARRDIDLAADDGPDARGLASLIEGDSAVHDAVVGDGQRLLPELFGPFSHAVDPARAVEQGIFTVDMEMYKSHTVTSKKVRIYNGFCYDRRVICFQYRIHNITHEILLPSFNQYI